MNKNVIFKDCLSDNDKIILHNCLQHDEPRNSYFWKDLLNTNQIRYQDGLYTKLQEGADCLKKYDREKHENIYKWFSLQQYPDEKISTICQDSVYGEHNKTWGLL